MLSPLQSTDRLVKDEYEVLLFPGIPPCHNSRPAQRFRPRAAAGPAPSRAPAAR